MAVVEVIYVVAATLWIVAVVAALCIGCLVITKYRKRRRRMTRLFDVVRMPLEIGSRGVALLRAEALSRAAVELPRLVNELGSGRVPGPSRGRRR